MRHYYRWLWPALLGLAACSTDTKPGREPATEAAVRPELAPDSGLRAATAPLATASNNLGAEPGKALIPDEPAKVLPADTSQTDAGQRVSELERLRYRATRRRGPTTLANAPTESPADSGPAALAAFCAAALPPAQVFVLRPDRDTIVIGAQGTQLFLPADAFDVPPGSGPVQVALREFYATPDILLAGLGTQTGPDLLETGGMVHVEATANGQRVPLRAGARYHLSLPTAERKPGMQLYQGVSLPSGRIDWQLPAAPTAAAADSLVIPDAAVEYADGRPPGADRGQRGSRRAGRRVHGLVSAKWQWPQYPRGTGRLRKDLAHLIPYTETTRARLKRGRRIGRAERESLKEATERFNEKILRVVRLDFLVDSTGAVTQPVALPGADAELGRAVAGALLQLPRWQPGQQPGYWSQQEGRRATMPGRILVAFGESGKVHVGEPAWDDRKIHDQYATRRANFVRARLDSIVRAQGKRPLEQAADYNERLLRARQRASWATANLSNSRARRAADTLNHTSYAAQQVYYELDAQGVGWINCDRLFTSTAPRISFGFKTREPGVVANLVFRNIRSIMAGEARGPEWYVFGGIPCGTVATLVAMKREKGITYLALKPLTVTDKPQQGLEFRAVTAAELRAALAQLTTHTQVPQAGGQ